MTDYSRGPYASKGVSEDVKTHTAEFVKALLEGGVEKKTIITALKKTCYSPSRRTLDQHLASLERGESLFSPEKNQGRPTLLTEEQKWIVAGWVLAQEKKVELFSIQQFVDANFDIYLSYPTVSRFIDEMELSVQLTSKRPMGIGMTKEAYTIGYFDFVKDLRDSGFWDFDKSRILCIDSVTNSMRSDRDTTISLVGSPQKKLVRNVPKYTNNYLVCVSMEGGIEFDVLMFTHDPVFDPHGPHWSTVKKWCRKLNLRTDQIYYTKSTNQYCAEQHAHISTFKARYHKELRGARILHDGGPAYKIDGEYILADGADRLVVLPSEQHGKLSPEDNWLNAIAKELWRADRTMRDFSYDSLLLLSKLESVGQDDVAKMWRHNFLLDKRELTLQAVQDRIGHVRGKRRSRQYLAKQYEDAYNDWSAAHVEVPWTNRPQELKGELDGAHWRKQ